MVDGSSMRAEPEVPRQHIGRSHVPAQPVARPVDDVVEPVQQHGHPADAALAHGDLQGRVPGRVAGPQPLGARRERLLAEQGGPELQRPARRAGTASSPELPTCNDTTVSVSTMAAMIGIPVLAVPQRGQADLVRPLGQGDRGEAPGGVAPDLGHGQVGVGQEGDAERHDPVRIGLVPLLEEPVVPGADAGQPQLAVGGGEEDPSAEAGDLGREVHRGPHPVDVHVADARLDVVAPGPHLVEAERLQPVGLGAPAGDGVHPHLGEALALEFPDLVALGGFDDTGGAIGQPAGRRPSKVSGGSTTWSSTEMTVARTRRGAGSGRKRS